MDELKPCPFCGGAVVRDEDGSHVYECTECGAITRMSIKSKELNACARNGLVIGDSDKWVDDGDGQWNTRYEATAERKVVGGTTKHCICGACEHPVDPWDNYCRECGRRLVGNYRSWEEVHGKA